MPRKTRRVALFHNRGAGEADHAAEELVTTIEAGGWAVTYFDTKRCDIAHALEDLYDVLAVAGGDGTVRKVALAARPNGPPIAILPFGTANNIANTLGIRARVQDLIAGWRDPVLRQFYPIKVEAPWGRQRLIEGLGLGVFAQAIDEGDDDDKLSPLEARQHIAEKLKLAEPQTLDIRIDEACVSGAFFLLEVTTIPLVGPNLYLAPHANPSDHLLDLCLMTTEEQPAMADWLEASSSDPAPLTHRAATHIAISGNFQRVRIDDAVHVDDRGGFGTIALAAAEEPLHFVVPRESEEAAKA